MNTQDKLAGPQEEIAGLPVYVSSLGGKYIISEGEPFWWEIHDYKERNKVRCRQSRRVAYRLHPEVHVEGNRRHEEKHPGAHAEVVKRYNGRHPGRMVEIVRRYNQTPKGKATLARRNQARREWSTDPEAYAARVEMLHVMRESCTKCHTPYTVTHQIDHILALCLGGTDSWDNLQPLCVLCHREKTAEDTHKLISAQQGNRAPKNTESEISRLRSLFLG